MFLFLAYYFQIVLDHSPVKTGLAVLPLTLTVQVGAATPSRREAP
ncbi:hypothetical protein OG905_05275 [Streptomyces sp. NBC_00322]|nr:hypothetical protein [Streptomyces sp. NBC_00322]